MTLNAVLSTDHFVPYARQVPGFCSIHLAFVGLIIAMCVPALVHAENVDGVSDLPFTVMTFNTGTGALVIVDRDENLGYGPEQARISDAYYGNGLAWKLAVDAVRDFVQEISPDIVAFQEMFYCGDCATVPEDARVGFICEDWRPGAPTVARIVLGEDYHIATHWGNNDKYLAVHKRFGRIRSCDKDFCLEGLEGTRLEGCGGGARVCRAVIERNSGELLTVITYHGTSGFSKQDKECRVRQIEQIFVDFGDGKPGVSGSANLIIGDFNTDPNRMRCFDRSARRWNDFVGDGKPFRFVSSEKRCAPGYYGPFNIDYIVSDVFRGELMCPSGPDEKPLIFQFRMFDHTPVVARISRR